VQWLKSAFIVGVGGGILIWVGTQLLSRLPDNQVHLFFCDVGQGDGILLVYKSIQVLIDSGPNQAILSCLARHVPPGDTTIEVAIATHPDLDHIGGFSAVFRHFKISHIFLIGVGKDTRDFYDFRKAVIEQLSRGTQVYLARSGQSITVHGVFQMKIISPQVEVGTLELFTGQKTETQLSDIIRLQEASIKSINDVSIGTFLQVGRYKTLLMADIEKESELALISTRVLGDIDILKAGHHGSKSSTTLPFLSRIQPEYVVISAGKHNRYNHPHPEVMDRLAIFRSKIYRTDEDGDIEWVTNGRQFYWKTQFAK
jgi:beta-lactamase superfamily II metal-dependent hydrolase